MNALETNSLPLTAEADVLFDSDFSTATLIMILGEKISIRTTDADRIAFEAEVKIGQWIRGNAAKALALKGVTVSMINRRNA